MSEVRLGIVGVGVIGKNHSGYLSRGEVEGMKITAVCDIDPEQLTWAKENLGEEVELFEDAEAMYDSGKIDAVLVATPHYDHPPLAIKAFQRGLHVMVEKPAGVYSKQVLELNKAAEKSGKVFGIIFQMRGIPVLAKVKELLDSGEAGEQVRSVWISTFPFRSQSYYDSGTWRATWGGEGGGVLFNQCPHTLDAWQWISGMPGRLRAFCSFGKYHDIEVEDDVTAYVEYPNGATGLFVASTGEYPGSNRLEISCDRGKILVEDDQLTFWRTTQPVSQFNREYKHGFGAPEVWKCEVPVTGEFKNHAEVMRRFTGAILKGEKLMAPGEEGLNSLELAQSMLLSTWTDDWVDLPADPDKYYQLLQEKIKTSRFKDKKATKVDMDVKKSFAK